MIPEKDSKEKTYITTNNWGLLAGMPPTPIESSEPTPILNRQQRRKQKQKYAPGITVVKGEMERLQLKLTNAYQRAAQMIAKFEKDPSKITYQGNPFVFELLEAERILPEVLEKAHVVNLETQFMSPQELNRMDDMDVFNKKVGGVSLSDIEKMELDEQGNLNRDDIKRINRLYTSQNRSLLSLLPFLRHNEDPRDGWIRQNIFFFVCQQEARPEVKTLIPLSLRPLHENLTAFFDHYSNRLTDFELGVWQERDLYVGLSLGGSWLSQALGCYIATKHGITPSSAIKLYKTRAEVSVMPTFYWKNAILRALEAGAVGAFKEHALPSDLQKYQHFDETVDRVATTQLVDFYKRPKSVGEDLAEKFEETEQMFDQIIGPYAKVLYEEVIKSHRRLEQPMPIDHVVDRVVVTSQNRKSIIFILLFKDNDTYLTLEIDRDRKIYGIPPEININYQEIIHPLWKDVLGVVLNNLKPKYPAVEPIKLSDYFQKSLQLEESSFDQDYPPTVFSDDYPRIELLRKREKSKVHRVLTPILQVLSEPPAPTDNEPAPKKGRRVIHSKGMIAEMLGGNPRPKDVEKLMRNIRMFENGEVTPKTINWSGGKRQVDRVGDFRLIYNHLGRGTYLLEAVGGRGNVYRDYGDVKV